MKITEEQVQNYVTKNLTNQSSLSDKEKDNIRYLFRALKCIYTHKFTSMWPAKEDLHTAMRLWAIKFRDCTRDEIDLALLRVADDCDWPPSIKEFRAIVDETRRNAELLTYDPTVKKPDKKTMDNNKRHAEALRKAVEFQTPSIQGEPDQSP